MGCGVVGWGFGVGGWAGFGDGGDEMVGTPGCSRVYSTVCRSRVSRNNRAQQLFCSGPVADWAGVTEQGAE